MLALPVPPEDVANVTYEVSLEGVSYGFEYRWNARDNRWYLSLFDAEAAPVAIGRAIAIGDDWLAAVPSFTSPPGALLAAINEDYLSGVGFASEGEDLVDPGYYDFARGRARLLYATRAEVEAIGG